VDRVGAATAGTPANPKSPSPLLNLGTKRFACCHRSPFAPNCGGLGERCGEGVLIIMLSVVGIPPASALPPQWTEPYDDVGARRCSSVSKVLMFKT
jgi:hypothetical protein